MQPDKITGGSVRGPFSKLLEDGRSWFSAEAKLAGAQLASDGRRLVYLGVLLGISLVTLCTGLMLFLFYCVALLAPHVGGMANAAGLLALASFVVAAISAWGMLRIVHGKLGVTAILKRWGNIFSRGPGSSS